MRAWPPFLLDLTAWHPWNRERGTLPPEWRDMTLEEICGVLRTPFWRPSRPWKMDLPGVAVRETKSPAEKTVTWTTATGVLTSRWVKGPDGDWWQSEYPVKTSADLAAAREFAGARRYILDHPERAKAGPGVVELPQMPWAELLHAFVGWSEGLLLLVEEPDAFREIVLLLAESLPRLVSDVARRPGDLVLSPDNLDGQFITMPAFAEHLVPGYAKTAKTLHAAGKGLIVHVGGPVRKLLVGLASTGIDCLQGVSGPPQGDSTLEEARQLVGPGMTLWGGIPQDCLLSTCSESEFRRISDSTFARRAVDTGVIVGVADRVPVDALPERLVTLSEMARQG